MHLLFFNASESDEANRPGAWVTLAGLILLAGLGLLLMRTVFFVDETQYVWVTQFGKPVQLYTDPGLALKWPYQSLRRFDRRLRIFLPVGREMLTEDKENLTFQWYVCWRIPGEEFAAARAGDGAPAREIHREIATHLERFLQAVGSVEAAENRLEERIQAAMAAEIGRVRFADLCSLEAGPSRLAGIAQRVHAAVRQAAAEQFGIEVVDVRLKQFNYPEAVKPAVYAEIRSERQRVAVQYRAEGASEKDRIESLADLKREQLLAEARSEAESIRGRSDAQAMEIYNAAHSRNPQFFELLKTLETYQSILDEQTTVVLSANSPLLKLLTEGLPPLPAATPEPPPPAPHDH